MRLSNRRILVTAAGQGIGRSAALACAREGAAVFATDRVADPLSELAAHGIAVAVVDGTDPSVVADHAATHGPFDGIINAIGYVHQGILADCPSDAWRRSFALNVDSFYVLLRAALPAMLDNGGGNIVTIASVASSIMGVPQRVAYSASKAAMIGLVKAIAADHVGQGIRINAVCPGTIATPSLEGRIAELGETVGGSDAARDIFIGRQPMGRLGTPEEIAEMCVHLVSESASFITGQCLVIDGGMSL